MKISSTEFQQNVGYYLSLAEKGEDIIVEKKRPRGVNYKITAEKVNSNEKKDKVQDLDSELSQYIGKIRVTENDSIKYQKKYRS